MIGVVSERSDAEVCVNAGQLPGGERGGGRGGGNRLGGVDDARDGEGVGAVALGAVQVDVVRV